MLVSRRIAAASAAARAQAWTKLSTYVSASSISTSSSPRPSKARSSCSYLAITLAPAVGGWGRCRLPRGGAGTGPVLLGDRVRRACARACRRCPRGACRGVGRVEHEVEQLCLARDVGVQRHRRDAESFRHRRIVTAASPSASASAMAASTTASRSSPRRGPRLAASRLRRATAVPGCAPGRRRWCVRATGISSRQSPYDVQYTLYESFSAQEEPVRISLGRVAERRRRGRVQRVLRPLRLPRGDGRGRLRLADPRRRRHERRLPAPGPADPARGPARRPRQRG